VLFPGKIRAGGHVTLSNKSTDNRYWVFTIPRKENARRYAYVAQVTNL